MSTWWGGGFITIINYSSGTESQAQTYQLITQNNIDILTQSSDNILVSVP